MKHWAIISVIVFLFSCESKPSNVCDGVVSNEMCFNFKTSGVTIQYWKDLGWYYKLEISNENSGAYYQQDIFLSVKLYDAVSDSVPQAGTYKGVSFLNPGVHVKQFQIDFYLNGSQDYKLDLSSYPELKIELITGETLHGTILAGFVNNHNTSDKQSLHVNFDNAWHL